MCDAHFCLDVVIHRVLASSISQGLENTHANPGCGGAGNGQSGSQMLGKRLTNGRTDIKKGLRDSRDQQAGLCKGIQRL